MPQSIMDELIKVSKSAYESVDEARKSLVDGDLEDVSDCLVNAEMYLSKLDAALVQFKALGDLMHFVTDD